MPKTVRFAEYVFWSFGVWSEYAFTDLIPVAARERRPEPLVCRLQAGIGLPGWMLAIAGVFHSRRTSWSLLRKVSN